MAFDAQQRLLLVLAVNLNEAGADFR